MFIKNSLVFFNCLFNSKIIFKKDFLKNSKMKLKFNNKKRKR